MNNNEEWRKHTYIDQFWMYCSTKFPSLQALNSAKDDLLKMLNKLQAQMDPKL